MSFKPRKNQSAIQLLRGKRWGGKPAVDHLFDRLSGEDGKPQWDYSTACEEIRKKTGKKIVLSTVSNWYKREMAIRRAEENYKKIHEATLRFFTETEVDNNDVALMVDAQLVFMTARIHAEDGAEEAIAALKAITNLKKVLIEDRKLTQRIREHDESVGKLKATIERLHKALKKHGLSEDRIDELNKEVVAAVDEMVRRNSAG